MAHKATFASSVVGAFALVLAACGTDVPRAPVTQQVCVIDEDGDGYGLGCSRGGDCDDGDPGVHEGCAPCATPEQGCPCTPGEPPSECVVESLIDEQTLLCHAGTRYCRDGAYTQCLGVVTFERPAPAPGELRSLSQALVPADAGTTPCSPCRPSCFPIRDPLSEVEDGLTPSNSSGVAYDPAGGVTVASTQEGMPIVLGPTRGCLTTVSPDADCDGLPDAVDPSVGLPVTSGTTRSVLYMDLPPGESNEAFVDYPAGVRTLDVYFLLDATAGMNRVFAPLSAALGRGAFLHDPDLSCADTDNDGVPNDDLKTGGIAGNVECLARDAQGGAGFSRQIPFRGPDSQGLTYGEDDSSLFESRADVSSDLGALMSRVGSMSADEQLVGPGAQIQALSVIASGAESYVGWDRPAVPPRVSCSAGRWGYPCFRDSALPLVLLLTGNPLYEGPATSQGHLGMGPGTPYPLDYPSAEICDAEVHQGSYPHYLPVASDNERFAPDADGRGGAFEIAQQPVQGARVGAIGDDYLTFTGDTTSMLADVNAAAMACEGLLDASGPDAVFRFRVDAPQALSVSARGTRFDAALGLLKLAADGTLPQPSSQTFAAGAGDVPSSPNDLGLLPAGAIVEVQGDLSGAAGDYPREVAGCLEQPAIADAASSTDYAADALLRFTLEEDATLTFDARSATGTKTLALFSSRPGLAAYSAGGVATGLDLVLPSAERVALPRDLTGNAVRLVAGYAGSGESRSGLPLSTVGLSPDVDAAAFAPSCAPVDATAPDMIVDFTVSQQTRLRLETSGEARGVGADFAHVLGLFRRPVPAAPAEPSGEPSPVDPGSLVACGKNNLLADASVSRAYVEATLAPGDYSAVVRGDASGDAGSFRLTLRDVGFLPEPIACASSDGSFSATLEACEEGFTAPCPGHERQHWALLRGVGASDASGAAGPYALRVRDERAGTPIDVCGPSGVADSYTGMLDAGDYVAVVKGTSASEKGLYQLTMGDASLASDGDYSDLASYEGGVRAALQERGIRVVGAQLGDDPALTEQLETLATDTLALTEARKPVVVQLEPQDPDLEGALGAAVVGAIGEVIAGTTMDVSLVPEAAPGSQLPGFMFEIQAIDRSDDGCDPPLDDVHQRCRAGAQPTFQVTLSNPRPPDQVEPNPADPRGGYWFVLHLVGDGRYTIERIPVYVIPADVTPEDTTRTYSASGSYWQLLRAQRCEAGEAADWSSLTWQATIPPGTRIEWKLCATDAPGDCAPELLARVTSGGPCAGDADCDDSFCQAGVCQIAEGGACLEDLDCGHGARCRAGTCRFLSLPLDPDVLLRASSGNGQPNLRVQVELFASDDRLAAPVVFDYEAQYECAPGD